MQCTRRLDSACLRPWGSVTGGWNHRLRLHAMSKGQLPAARLASERSKLLAVDSHFQGEGRGVRIGVGWDTSLFVGTAGWVVSQL